MADKKGIVDSLFDFADSVVDGATAVLREVPEQDSSEEPEEEPKRVIDVPVTPRETMSNKKKLSEVYLFIKNVSRRKGGGVSIVAETPTHEVVCIQLREEDWKKVYDAADWFRMVNE